MLPTPKQDLNDTLERLAKHLVDRMIVEHEIDEDTQFELVCALASIIITARPHYDGLVYTTVLARIAKHAADDVQRRIARAIYQLHDCHRPHDDRRHRHNGGDLK